MAFLFAKAARLVTCHDQLKTSWDVTSLGFIGFFTSLFFEVILFLLFSVSNSANENLKYISLKISLIFISLLRTPRLSTDLACAFLRTRASDYPIDSSAEKCRIKRDQEAFVDCTPLHRFTSGLLLGQSSFLIFDTPRDIGNYLFLKPYRL